MLHAGEEARIAYRIACSFGKDNKESSLYFRPYANKLLRGSLYLHWLKILSGAIWTSSVAIIHEWLNCSSSFFFFLANGIICFNLFNDTAEQRQNNLFMDTITELLVAVAILPFHFHFYCPKKKAHAACVYPSNASLNAVMHFHLSRSLYTAGFAAADGKGIEACKVEWRPSTAKDSRKD